MSRQVGAKYRGYSQTNLEAAVRMVEDGAMSKRKAASLYGVPRTTIIDKVSGRTQLGLNPGRSTVLSQAEETVLVDYIKLMGSIGYPLKKQELLHEVKRVLDHDGRRTPFKNNLPGKDWYYGFCKRHPDVTLRTAMTLGHQRALITKEMIANWFSTLEGYLKKEVPDWEAMLKDPRRCFNADESGFPLCVNTGKVLAQKGVRHVYQVTSSAKQQLTVMVSFNAIGNYLPPLIIFPGERFRDSGLSDFPDAIYAHSPNGWMDSDLFVEFLKHMNSYVVEQSIPKPVILYVDGHSTHMSLEATTFCHENDIVLYCLFPNATHLLQPCDVGLFGPMKSAWKKQVKIWHLENIGQNFTKKHFPGVFKETWNSVTKIETAVHGFSRCGLFPLCPDNIDCTKLAPSKVHKQTVESPSASDISKSSTAVSSSASMSPLTASNPIPSVSPSFPVSSVVLTSSNVPLCEIDQSDKMSTSIVKTTSTISSSCSSQIIERTSNTRNMSDLCTFPLGVQSANHILLDGTGDATQSVSVKCVVKNHASNSVSPSFSLLTVPEIKPKKKMASIREKLPKALSGTEALRILKEREQKKIEDEAAKQKRKEDRLMKKKEREEEKERKKKEREEKKIRQLELKRILKTKQSSTSKRRKVDESSSDSDISVNYTESDDGYDEYASCPGCITSDGVADEWVNCTKCPRKWHISCTGDPVLLEIPVAQMKNYPYMCEFCVSD